MLRRDALLGFTITTRNPSLLLGSSSNIPTLPLLNKVSSSTAAFTITLRAMSSSPNSTPVNLIAQNEEQVRDFMLLNAVNDRYGGVVVEMTEPMDPALFASILRASIAQWRHQGKKGVWIKLPIQHANLVEAAVKEGFWFHHAEPNYLMLAYWIPEGAHTLPANASHRVGVGAFVMNEKKEILAVQENGGRFRGKGIWKPPTGVVNEGEDLCTAVVRQVKGETAIDTEFVEVLPFRFRPELSQPRSEQEQQPATSSTIIEMFQPQTLTRPSSPSRSNDYESSERQSLSPVSGEAAPSSAPNVNLQLESILTAQLHQQWQNAVLAFCFSYALSVSLQSMATDQSNHDHLPLRLVLLLFLVLLTFIFILVAFLIHRSCKRTSQALEKVAFLLAATAFCHTLAIPLSFELQCTVWAVFILSLLIVMIFMCLNPSTDWW